MADLPIAATPKPMLILTVLDRSGSMATKRADVIGGFNTFLGEQQAQPGVCRMAVIAFNTEWVMLAEPAELAKIQPLTAQTYAPGGGTALLDAVAHAVQVADKAKRADERVLCLIITDGEENSSRETTKAQLLEIIKQREAQGDWTFTYMGPDPAKFAEQGYVSSVRNASVYHAQAPGQSFASVSRATSGLRGMSAGRTDAFYGGDETATAAAPPVDKPADVQ